MADPTFAEVYSSYLTNASYEEDGSVAEAKSFVTACRRLIAMRAKRSRMEGITETEFDVGLIQQEMQDARNWLAANDTTAVTGGNTAFLSTEDWSY